MSERIPVVMPLRAFVFFRPEPKATAPDGRAIPYVVMPLRAFVFLDVTQVPEEARAMGEE